MRSDIFLTTLAPNIPERRAWYTPSFSVETFLSWKPKAMMRCSSSERATIAAATEPSPLPVSEASGCAKLRIKTDASSADEQWATQPPCRTEMRERPMAARTGASRST